MNKFLRQLSLLALLFCWPLMSQAARTFTDQIGRQVTVPDTVDRVVVLQHQTLNLLVQMNATDKIVGVMANWKQQLGDGYARLAPELAQKASLGDLTHVDPEKLVALRPQVAKALIEAMDKGRKMVSDRLQSVPENERVRAYMANPELTTYGSGKYTGLMMAHAGALNVAASSVKGFKQVTMEQVIAWDPQVIFVQNRYPKVVNEILHNPQWQVIDAVKHHRVYLMPDYAKAWGYPMPEAVGIGELWMAKKLYPEKFHDIDMQKAANDWYQRFYRTDYQGVQ
ncbi:ABC transporter substrate-binding protein [Salmonella enterica]|nr:ABC transporter substrate-binding protein [Salmonella enterica]